MTLNDDISKSAKQDDLDRGAGTRAVSERQSL